MTTIPFKAYYVQRLENPREIPSEAEDVSLAGYFKGEQPKDAVVGEKLYKYNQFVRLNYMGSSEFEFGAFGKSIRELIANKDQIVPFSMVVKGSDQSGFSFDKIKDPKVKKVKLTGWCVKGHEEQLRAFILDQLGKKNARTKECTEMDTNVFGTVTTVKGKPQVVDPYIIGWYDLQSYWLVTSLPCYAETFNQFLQLFPDISTR